MHLPLHPTCRHKPQQQQAMRVKMTHTPSRAEDAAAACAFAVSGPLFTPLWVPTRRPTCAVVSSAPSLRGAGCGHAIDSHEVVLRMNHAPTRGYERDAGARTTIAVLNSHHVRALRRAKPAAQACATPTSLLFFGDEWLPTDNETAVAATLNLATKGGGAGGAGGRPCRVPAQVGVKALQLSPNVGAWRGAVVTAFNAALHSAGRRRGSRIPTAGFYAVHAALGLCRRVSLFGFREDGAGDANAKGDSGRSADGLRNATRMHYWADEVQPGTGAAALRASHARTRHYHDMELEHEYFRRLWEDRDEGGVVHVCAV